MGSTPRSRPRPMFMRSPAPPPLCISTLLWPPWHMLDTPTQWPWLLVPLLRRSRSPPTPLPPLTTCPLSRPGASTVWAPWSLAPRDLLRHGGPQQTTDKDTTLLFDGKRTVTDVTN